MLRKTQANFIVSRINARPGAQQISRNENNSPRGLNSVGAQRDAGASTPLIISQPGEEGGEDGEQEREREQRDNGMSVEDTSGGKKGGGKK